MNGKINRREFLKQAGISAAAMTVSGCMSKEALNKKALPEKPNIIMYITDDHGYEFSGCYGNDIVRTPNLDNLAKQGVRFTNVFAASPTCTPSRSVMYTGLMPFRNGAHPNHSAIKPGVKALPWYLKQQGYRVVLAGKTHVNPFEQFEFEHIEASLPANPKIVRNYRQEGIDIRAVEKLMAEHKQKNSGQPLCLIIAEWAPHAMWAENKGFDINKIKLPVYLVDTQKTREAMTRYYSDIAEMDERLGEFLGAMKRQGYEENSLFIYTADEGPEWPHAKWTLYDAGLRVPFIVRWPNVTKAGSTNDAMISLVDITPTFIDIAGGRPPQDLDGTSFLGVLSGSAKRHREEIYAAHTRDGEMNYYPCRCIRTKTHKYILNLYPENKYTTHFSEAPNRDHKEIWDTWVEKAKTDKAARDIVNAFYYHPAEELYDLRRDPYEMKDIAGEPENKRVLEELRNKVKQWMVQQGDDGPQEVQRRRDFKKQTGWTLSVGNWQIKDGSLVPDPKSPVCMLFGPEEQWKDYVYQLRAKKTEGSEGFLIMFRAKGRVNYYQWNIGGWNNTANAVQNGRKVYRKEGSIENDKWYDIRVELKGAGINCFLDNQLVHNIMDDKFESGGIGLGCRGTKAEFRDISVTDAQGKKIYEFKL